MAMAEWRGWLLGEATLSLAGADPAWALNRLAAERVPFWAIEWEDAFTVQITVPRSQVRRAISAIEGAMCQAKVLSRRGLPGRVRQILHRPVLLAFLIFNLLLVLILPQFVLFYQVTGNETVPEEQILRALSDLGVGFGTFGPDIKPLWIKNHILNEIPELQWITVTQNGCCAQVVVRERVEEPETENQKGYGHVVATQSGLVTEMSVLSGQALCQVGDTVLAGERLVSGLVDLERTYTLTQAKAEIYARTWRKGEVVTPSVYLQKTPTGDTFHCLWLEVGGRSIKIFGNSGILVDDCDKMVERKPLTLPGGLELPVTLVVETYVPYERHPAKLSQLDAQLLLEQSAEDVVKEDMVAGEILGEDSTLTLRGGVYTLRWEMECHEMIAKSVELDYSEEDFAHDGTNRERGANGAGD